MRVGRSKIRSPTDRRKVWLANCNFARHRFVFLKVGAVESGGIKPSQRAGTYSGARVPLLLESAASESLQKLSVANYQNQAAIGVWYKP